MKEIINQNNLDTADEIVAQDFVELDPLPGQEQGREGLKRMLAAFFGGSPISIGLSKSRPLKGIRWSADSGGKVPIKVSFWVSLLLVGG